MQFSRTLAGLSRRVISGSVDKNEIIKFSELASSWWQHDGPMRPLHAMNPCRVQFMIDCLNRSQSATSLEGLKILDVGCGAGILSESLARLGAQVLGIDASKEAIHAAQDHSRNDPLLNQNLVYRHGTVENLAVDSQGQFDAVACLEVVEHVNNPEEFITSLSNLVKNEGHLFLSTINRTPQSFVISILAAEYITRLIPIGTHEWNKFITPLELGRMVENAHLPVQRQAGIVFNPIRCRFQLSPSSLDNNYIVHCCKKSQSECKPQL